MTSLIDVVSASDSHRSAIDTDICVRLRGEPVHLVFEPGDVLQVQLLDHLVQTCCLP